MGKMGWWFAAFFGPIGLLFAGLGIAFFISDREYETDGIKTTGAVVRVITDSDDGTTTYRPVVTFVDQTGQRHQFTSNAASSWWDYSRGDPIDVVYLPDKPEKARIDGFLGRLFLPLMFFVLGSFFALAGAVFLWITIRRRMTIARLKLRGVRIEAEFVECFMDTSMHVNGEHPYRVLARGKHPHTKRKSKMISDPMWRDLTDTLQGKTVPVFVGKEKPKPHFVDLSEWISKKEWA
ncbi:MAG: DUF3592 domain-containing protein [Pseudomonadota bacterium]|nr:DUF3592 domain-containing protein [Pseudomonadota bacterium]